MCCFKYMIERNIKTKKYLTHSSKDGVNNYEKLEFLGDRELEVRLVNRIVNDHPNAEIKEWQEMINIMKSNKHLADISKKLGFSDNIKTNTGTKVTEKMEADIIEALIAQLVIDGLDRNLEELLNMIYYVGIYKLQQSK